MKIWSDSFKDNQAIPARYAFGKMDAQTHVALSDNRNPHLAWSDVPVGTKSLAVICHDYDVPSRGDDVNQEGKTVPADLPRVDFYHWVLFDLPADKTSIADGEFSDKVTARGKSGPATLYNARQAINDYAAWFAGDAEMSGDYYGYDGPCPPWNDSIPHHYMFTVYALDIEKLAVDDRATGPDVMKAMEGHILGKDSITGVYSLNPAVADKI